MIGLLRVDGGPAPCVPPLLETTDLIRNLRALAVLSLVALLLSACTGGTGSATSSPATGPASPSGTSPASFDQQFIDMMVPHHQAAVQMAQIAQDRGEHPEVRQLAGEIIAAQDAEIMKLREWRKAWFGSEATPPMSAVPMLPGMEMGGHTMGGDMMDMTTDVEMLRTADPFDKAFIDAMIPHHESAIAAAKLAQQQAGRSEIKQLAGEIIAAQESEIDRMKGWLEAWY